MATQSPPPDAPAPEPAPEVPAASPSTAGVYEYVDLTPRTYHFDGAPPQTAEFGDICPLPYDPQDGRWQPSKKRVTRLPDPQQAAQDAEAQRAAYAKAADQGASASGKA